MSEKHSDRHFHIPSAKKQKKKPVLRKQKTTSLQGLPSPGSLLFAHSISGASAACLCVCQVLAIKGWFSGAHLAVASAILVTNQSVNKSDSSVPWGHSCIPKSWGLACKQLCPQWMTQQYEGPHTRPLPGEACLGPSHQREMGRSEPEVQDCQMGRKHFKIWSE